MGWIWPTSPNDDVKCCFIHVLIVRNLGYAIARTEGKRWPAAVCRPPNCSFISMKDFLSKIAMAKSVRCAENLHPLNWWSQGFWLCQCWWSSQFIFIQFFFPPQKSRDWYISLFQTKLLWLCGGPQNQFVVLISAWHRCHYNEPFSPSVSMLATRFSDVRQRRRRKKIFSLNAIFKVVVLFFSWVCFSHIK